MKILRHALLKTCTPILRYYPLKRGKSLIQKILLPDLTLLPTNKTVKTKEGILFPLLPDPFFKQLYLFGEYEPENTALYSKVVKPGQTVIDIGANFGWYTALLAKRVGNAGKVHSFEPLVELTKYISGTLALNNLHPNVSVNCAALGCTEGKADIFTFKDLAIGHASLNNLGRNDAIRNTCRITTLDTYVEREVIGPINFIKIDVEGHELEVLKGATRVLGMSNGPIIAFEININCLENRNLCSKDLQEYLEKFGYTAFWEINPFCGIRRVKVLNQEKNCDYITAKKHRAKELEVMIQ